MGDLIALGTEGVQSAQEFPLRADEQAVMDFADNERPEYGDLLRFLEKIDKAQERMQDIGIDVRDGEPLVGAGPGRAGRRDFRREPGDQVLVQIKAQRQKGPLRAGIRDVKGARHVHPGHEALVFAVAVLLGAQHGPLGALNDHADGRLGEAGFNPVGFMPPRDDQPFDVHRILPVLGRPLEQFLFQQAGGSCRLSTPCF